ncbi:PAS domain S-box protein [Maribacter arcticus]|uniref:PAS domain S-box protein n=1 Tax=Maribacter arcticus TaxID=561365 RepID=UPI003002AF69
MDNKEVILLKKALERQKKARRQAEKILEDKSMELYFVNHHLKEANSKLENLINEKNSEIEGVFINIIDAYVVMGLDSKVINMNTAAKEMLEFDHTLESVKLTRFIHPDFVTYTEESMLHLMQVGTLQNYQAKIIINDTTEKWVQINCSLIYNNQNKPIAAQGIIRDITKETEAKILISKQKKQLDVIVDNSPIGIVLTVNGVITKTNDAFSHMLGFTSHELKNTSLKTISEPESSNDENCLFDQIENGELDKFTTIFRFTKKNGSKILAKTMMTAITKDVGKTNYQVAIIEDISKEFEADRKIKASEDRLSKLISNLQTGVLLEDEFGKIALINQKFCDLHNITKSIEQLKGVDCKASVENTKNYFKQPEKVVKRIEEILAKKETVLSDELEMIDGTILERDYIAINSEGDNEGHLWTYRDVTFNKKYHTNLELQREKYYGIINNMNLGLVELDIDGVIQFVNDSFCLMCGFNKEELFGKKPHNIFNIKDTELFNKKKKQRLKGFSNSYETEIVDKHKNIKYWFISGGPRYNDLGLVVGSIGVFLDITKQKNLELQKEKLLRKLEVSNQGLEDYAHIVSHDLKSPLRSISALATWLIDDYKDVLDEGGKQYLELLQEKVASMDKLIHGILEYSTVNISEHDSSEVNLNAVISEIAGAIYIPDHVELVVTKELPTIDADRTKMYQLFQNIISNAVVHIEREVGVVEVLFKEEVDLWHFTISDNGIGIPKEYHKKIFDIFQSIGNKERSTGIGLSIVKKIIDYYGGRVWIDSVVGEGTQFHFTIMKN